MILIADSGSTKTDWAIVTASSQPVVLSTQGINPIHQSREQIVQIIREEFMGPMGSSPDVQKLRSGSILSPDFPYAVYFYGSGVRPEMEQLMSSLLSELFPQASIVEAHSDLLGAARALCGRKEGIACILGTGANSCLYDGNGIVQHTPALGYILGDEGSGAALGKRFLHDLYCGILSPDVLQALTDGWPRCRNSSATTSTIRGCTMSLCRTSPTSCASISHPMSTTSCPSRSSAASPSIIRISCARPLRLTAVRAAPSSRPRSRDSYAITCHKNK